VEHRISVVDCVVPLGRAHNKQSQIWSTDGFQAGLCFAYLVGGLVGHALSTYLECCSLW
jgi:hypothetical protein